MLEGAILFAAAATRRLESSDPGALAYPFTVRPTGANNGGLSSSDEGQARAEIWMPLWERPATAGELKQLLSEGRATLRAKTARDGLGFARAIAALGGGRGITAFQRYGFLMRSGKAYLATPLSRVQVRSNPQAQLIDDLESGGFLDRLKRFARAVFPRTPSHAPWTGNSALQVLPDSRKGQRNIGRPRGRQDAGDPRDRHLIPVY